MRHQLTVARFGLLSGMLMLAVLTFSACPDGEGVAPTATPGPSTPTATASAWRPFALWAELHCEGRWVNDTFGTSGRYALSSTAATNGGAAVTIEADGEIFGGQSVSASVPVIVDDSEIRIVGDAGLLGQADVRLTLAQELSGGFTAPPGLPPGSELRLSNLTLAGTTIRFEASLYTDGTRLPGVSVITAECLPRQREQGEGARG